MLDAHDSHAMIRGMKWLLPFVSLLLAACGNVPEDWRIKAVENGKQAIISELGNTGLRFSEVQVVGDDKTGQICGKVSGPGISTNTGAAARFVVYIDGTAGPWIESDLNRAGITVERFYFAWDNDCVKEGWHSQ